MIFLQKNGQFSESPKPVGWVGGVKVLKKTFFFVDAFPHSGRRPLTLFGPDLRLGPVAEDPSTPNFNISIM